MEDPAPGSGKVARKKTPKTRVNVKASLSRRLREIRQELFGEHGGPELARRLNLPARTWYNYETGVTVPAEVLLGFIEQTSANPMWLLSGEGPRYSPGGGDRSLSDLTPVELIRRGLEQLERDRSKALPAVSNSLPSDASSDFVAVHVLPMHEISKTNSEPLNSDGYVMAYRKWLPNPSTTIGARLTDEAMQPVLPAGSIVAIDRSIVEPSHLNGQIVAACPDGVPMIRWLEISGRHLILRPNQPTREFPLIPVEFDDRGPSVLLGQVVWSWSRFSRV